MKLSGTEIIATGHVLPEERITNEFFGPAGLTEEWILERTGIRERRRAAAGDSASSLGASAAMSALAKTELKPSDIDLIICSTISPDVQMPSTACLIQSIIGASHAICF